MKGFLGTGAPFWSDFNLVVQLAMGATLIVGMFLARGKKFTAHKYVQSTVVLLNLVLIGTIMVPSFTAQVPPQIPGNLGTAFAIVPIVHAFIGVLAEALGLYIVAAAGFKILPPRFRFRRFKPWMRTAITLWWAVILLGVGTYYVWYAQPGAQLKVHIGAHGAHAFTISATDFKFTPTVATVTVGTRVTWVNDSSAQHTVTSDSGRFHSGIINPRAKFSFTFTKAGEYKYHCDFHAGLGMNGEVDVR